MVTPNVVTPQPLVPAELLQDSDRILFIAHLALGDFAYLQSGLRAFSEAYPHLKIHVWVDETRPRNQGAALTAYELGGHGVPHTVIVDNAGGHLMQRGQVDMVIVGTDRTTANGDVANKIGTYLKALAAHDNGVPFYVALPSPTIDWSPSASAGPPPAAC